MTDVYTVVCREGEYDDISWRDIGAFFDEAVANGLCEKAQACYDELRKQFPEGVKLTGLNPHDPGFDSSEEARYFVQHTVVTESVVADLAAADKVTVLERFPALPDDKTFFAAIDVEERFGDRAGIVESARGSYELYDPPTLMKIQYRNLVFVLQLRDGISRMHHDWDDHRMEFEPVLRSSLSAEDWQRIRTAREIDLTREPRSHTCIRFDGVLSWTSPEFDYFMMDLDIIPSGERAILEQFTRAFEAWLANQVVRRLNQPEFDNELKRVGL